MKLFFLFRKKKTMKKHHFFQFFHRFQEILIDFFAPFPLIFGQKHMKNQGKTAKF